MRRFQPGLECLEGRWCPATTIGIKDLTTIVIKGDNEANQVVIDDLGNGAVRISVDGGDASEYAKVKKIIVRGGQGDDVITYNLAVSPTRALKLALDGGDGNDTITCAVAAPIDGPGRARVIEVKAGTGADVVTGTFAGVAGGRLIFGADLGAGDDTIDLAVGGGVTGVGTAAFAVLGKAGADVINVDATGVDLGNRAVLAISLLGGADNDAINAAYQGKFNGFGLLSALGNQGDDVISLVATLDEGSQGTLGGGVSGDAGNDVLTFQVHVNDSDLAEVLAILDGGKGQDQGLRTGNVRMKGIESGIPVPPGE